ncbi:MAG: glutamine--fructose-6-phosphate transaminase (isomerizing), partial [Bdellovibrionales bacterium]|nr:glutamine--fructose-6-phosphate transaminase (isomerizing) [Bdellovibrionales bacterium]
MCGIVGYYGEQQPKDVIISGLKALEYRGYDSAGVTILEADGFKRVRAEGKLSNLQSKLEAETFSGRLGIGHTRWATHGPPVEKNAHPHLVAGTSIVHNGIVENYADLKEELAALGASFESDTDSELIAHLVSREIAEGKILFDAVLAVLPKLRGAYSVLVINDQHPDEIVAFKNGPPLLFGADAKQVVVASDLQAILPYVQDVVFLEDDEIAHCKGSEVSVFSADGKPLKKKSQHIQWDKELTEKQGFSHFMLKEIYEQPRAVANAIDQHINLETKSIELNRLGFGQGVLDDIERLNFADDLENTNDVLKGIERIFVVACGTSFYAGLVGEYLIERYSKIPVECELGSEFRYRYPVIPENSLVITISQSGETADTLAALRLARDHGAQILSICNVKNSSIDREADGHMYMNAGVEIGVASTKALSSTLGLLTLLAGALAKSRGLLPPEQEQSFVETLLAAPSHMESVLA